MKRSQVTSTARDWAGTAAKFAVASGLADKLLRHGMSMRRSVMRRSRPNVALRLARGLLLAAAVVGVALIGPKLMRREHQRSELNLGEINPRPTP